MSKRESPYPGHRFPPVLISHAVWLYTRFCLSFREILVQRRRDARAAERFLRKVLGGQGEAPRRLVTDKLRSCSPAVRSVLADSVHDTSVYVNNAAELSHQPTRCRERQMRRFKSERHTQRFLSLHARVQNLFRYGRHLLRAANHRLFRRKAFDVWSQVTCA
jgi:putative transposase